MKDQGNGGMEDCRTRRLLDWKTVGLKDWKAVGMEGLEDWRTWLSEGAVCLYLRREGWILSRLRERRAAHGVEEVEDWPESLLGQGAGCRPQGYLHII